MSFAIERELIETRFNDEWTTTPVAWDNTKFETTGESWVKVLVISGEGQKETLGNGAYLYPSTLVFEIHSQKYKGMAETRTIADSLSTMFANIELSQGNTQLVFKAPNLVKQMGDGDFIKNALMIPYDRIVKGV